MVALCFGLQLCQVQILANDAAKLIGTECS